MTYSQRFILMYSPVVITSNLSQYYKTSTLPALNNKFISLTFTSVINCSPLLTFERLLLILHVRFFKGVARIFGRGSAI